MTLFNPVFNCLTPIVIKRSKTQARGGTDSSRRSWLCRSASAPSQQACEPVQDRCSGPCSRPRHAAAWRSRNRAPAGWVAWATNAITEGRARFRIGTQWCSRSGCWNRRAPARPCGRGKLAQFSLLHRFAVWWVAPPWPILSVPAVLLALCRLVERKHASTATLQHATLARLIPALSRTGRGLQVAHPPRLVAHSTVLGSGYVAGVFLALFVEAGTETPVWVMHETDGGKKAMIGYRKPRSSPDESIGP